MKFTADSLRAAIAAYFQKSLVVSVSRFPLAHLFSAVLFLAASYMVVDDSYKGVLIYYLSSGFLLSLMLELWGEETGHHHRFWAITGISHLILAIDAIYLWNLDMRNFDEALLLSRASVVIAILLGIFYLSFLRQRNDVQSWNFVRRLFLSAILCQIVGGVMFGGTGALIWGIELLFGFDFSYKVYSVNILFWVLFVPQLLFLSRIPMGEKKHDDVILTSGFLSSVTRYLFIPLAACYLLVLYGYMLKILLAWELPKGIVSYSVSAMMVIIVVIEFLLYPSLRTPEAKNYERWAARWLPMLALPLLLLMTVGICRRLSDYGITAIRLYVITLNFWFYCVCLGLWLTKGRRIHWVSLSFAALLLLSSAHPFNYSELTRRYMLSSIQKVITHFPPAAMPMTQSGFAEWIDSLPEEQRALTYSRFQYLNDWERHRSDLDPWIKRDIYLYQDYEDISSPERVFVPWNADTLAHYHVSIPEYYLPKGYSHMKSCYETERYDSCPSDSIIRFLLRYKTSFAEDSAYYSFSIPALRQWQTEQPACVPLQADSLPAPLFTPRSIVIQTHRGILRVTCGGNLFFDRE